MSSGYSKDFLELLSTVSVLHSIENPNHKTKQNSFAQENNQIFFKKVLRLGTLSDTNIVNSINLTKKQ